MSENLKQLVEKANAIMNDSNLDFKEKYDLIFSKHISDKIYEYIDLEYYNPDSSYEEDLYAFIRALNEKWSKIGKYIN